MPLYFIRQDITKVSVDAIVNAANETLLGGGGVDGAIHRAAGPGLLKECRTLGGCRTGEAKITRGYALPCRYVIHTVGPVWYGGTRGEAQALEACYRNSLRLALEYGCESVAFPLISSGVFGYPKDQALKIAADTIASVLEDCDLTVYLVFFDRASLQIGEALVSDVASYIDDHYAEVNGDSAETFRRRQRMMKDTAVSCHLQEDADYTDRSLASILQNLDESFSEMLLRKIDESGMTDAQCYKRANVDRKLFSKIRKDRHYRPSKPTAIAFAVALRLSLSETAELLRKAGYALSHSNKFDVIIEYFIRKGNYDIFLINETLFAFDQPLLGV